MHIITKASKPNDQNEVAYQKPSYLSNFRPINTNHALWISTNFLLNKITLSKAKSQNKTLIINLIFRGHKIMIGLIEGMEEYQLIFLKTKFQILKIKNLIQLD